MYKSTINNEQLSEFLNLVGNFHDGVIATINYVSGSTGNRNGTFPQDKLAEIKMIIQGCDCGEIEILFSKVTKCIIIPTSLNFTSEILLANIQYSNDNFIFAQDVDNLENEIKCNKSNQTCIVSKNLSYKITKY